MRILGWPFQKKKKRILEWQFRRSGGYENTWGLFRPVVATATRLFPLVRTFIAWMSGVDASRNAGSSALSEPGGSSSRRLGISPGGIAEMFETFPKPGYHKNDEAVLLKDRNGLFKLAVKGLPTVSS